MIPSLGLGRRITGLRYRRRRGLIVPWRLLVTTATVFARHEVFKLRFSIELVTNLREDFTTTTAVTFKTLC